MKFCDKENINKGKIIKKLITDTEILSKIKNGDQLAELDLISKYKDLVVKISRCYFIAGGDLEDIIQEGMIGLYKAIKNYNPSKEASFKTFAVLCIKHQIQSAIKSSTANKNKPLSSAVSFQDFAEDSNGNSFEFLPVELIFDESPEDEAINKEEYVSLKKKIKDILSPLEYKVLNYYIKGYTYKEISITLGVTEKSIDNSLSRIKTKLKAKLNK